MVINIGILPKWAPLQTGVMHPVVVAAISVSGAGTLERERG